MEIHVEIYYLFIQAVNGDFIICSYFLYIAALKHSNRWHYNSMKYGSQYQAIKI